MLKIKVISLACFNISFIENQRRATLQLSPLDKKTRECGWRKEDYGGVGELKGGWGSGRKRNRRGNGKGEGRTGRGGWWERRRI